MPEIKFDNLVICIEYRVSKNIKIPHIYDKNDYRKKYKCTTPSILRNEITDFVREKIHTGQADYE